MKFLKKNFVTIFCTIAFFVGLGLIVYPTFSDYWNGLHQSRAIASYTQAVSDKNEAVIQNIWNEAEEYNSELRNRELRLLLTDEEMEEYNQVLDVTGTGIMGHIEIPKINCSLPIYHGTDEGVLQIAVGHIAGTSMPVGGEGTHCSLSGHRGLPSAKLFTDIDQLVVGDEFMLRILNETLTYEVDQILIVQPAEIQPLAIEEGQDLCTLITCTPYGVNTHRLLVRGHRVETSYIRQIHVPADALQIDEVIVALVIAVPLLLLLLIGTMIPKRKKR